ncbi:sodium-coupled monocarboxylate transporter 1-like [Haemaphysalis longicornis]
MTLFSCVCAYLGSIIRVLLMVKSAATGPFTGLLFLAIGFPFVHSKGAGISTMVALAFQLFVLWQDINSGARAPRMTATLDYCPENSTYIRSRANHSASDLPSRSPFGVSLFTLSPFWSCFFGTFTTVVLGVFISIASGEHRLPRAPVRHLNCWFVQIWRKLGILESYNAVEVSNHIVLETSPSWKKGENRETEV